MQAMKRELHADWTRDFTDTALPRLLGKCYRSSWIMSPDFRSASIDEGLFRESALLSSNACDHVLVKECQYQTYSSDIIFYLLSNWKTSGDTNIFTIKSSYRLFRDHLANERN